MAAPLLVSDLVERFERNRGEYVHVCHDRQPGVAVVPTCPTISQLLYEETSK
jgi:hypothetical protein